MYWPRKLPSGAAMVVARALPPFSRPSARGVSCGGTSRITVAADIDQKPPTTTPIRARLAMNTAALGASDTIRPEMIIATVRPSSTCLRSMQRVSVEMHRLVATANRPETAMAWPAWPSVTCRSAAIGVSRLTGMNSEAIKVDTQRVRAPTAFQAERGARALAGAAISIDKGASWLCPRRRRHAAFRAFEVAIRTAGDEPGPAG